MCPHPKMIFATDKTDAHPEPGVGARIRAPASRMVVLPGPPLRGDLL